MDTSQEYIEMWYKAITMFPELLENWVKSDWDFTWYKTDNPDDPNVLYRYDDFCWIGVQIGGNSICDYPLPRQDQLQELYSSSLYRLCTGFCNWLKRETGLYNYDFGSMEQLWLSFIMYKKFNKKWDGAMWQ